MASGTLETPLVTPTMRSAAMELRWRFSAGAVVRLPSFNLSRRFVRTGVGVAGGR